MKEALRWFKASDGTAATAMDTDLVSQWLKKPIGGYISWQIAWGTGPVGKFTQQGSNDSGAINDVACTADDYPDVIAAGAQPAGTAGSLTIGRQCFNDTSRLKYTRTSGTAAVPTGNVIW